MDDYIVVIGSMNLDSCLFCFNFEIIVLVVDEVFVVDVEVMLCDDFVCCCVIDVYEYDDVFYLCCVVMYVVWLFDLIF